MINSFKPSPSFSGVQVYKYLQQEPAQTTAILRGMQDSLRTEMIELGPKDAYTFNNPTDDFSVKTYAFYQYPHWVKKLWNQRLSPQLRLLAYVIQNPKNSITDIALLSYDTEDSKIEKLLRQHTRKQGLPSVTLLETRGIRQALIQNQGDFLPIAKRVKSHIALSMGLKPVALPKHLPPKVEAPATP